MSKNARLPKSLTLVGAWSLGLGGIVGWGSFIMPGTTFLPQAGPLGTLIALFIASIIMLVIAANFHFMSQKLPFTGGAFVYAQKTFGSAHGFACGWFLCLAYLTIIAQNGTALSLISSNLLGGFAEVGFSYDIAGYTTYLGDLALAFCAFAFCAFMLSRSSKAGYRTQSVLVICLIICVAALAIGVFAVGDASASDLQPAFSPTVSPAFGILSILALSPWAFVGFEIVTQSAEELSFSVRKTGLVMALGIVFGAVIYVTLSEVAAAITPAGYANWAEYVAALPDLEGAEAVPLFNAAISTFGPSGTVILVIAALGAVLSGVVGFYFAASRLLFAMADAGLFNKPLAKLDASRKTPVGAIALILAVVCVFSLLGRTVLSWILDTSSVGAALGFLYASAAAFKHARTDGSVLYSATGLIGVVLSVFFILLLVLPIPQIGSTLSPESLVVLVAWAALGLNFYQPKTQSSTTTIITKHLKEIDSEKADYDAAR